MLVTKSKVSERFSKKIAKFHVYEITDDNHDTFKTHVVPNDLIIS